MLIAGEIVDLEEAEEIEEIVKISWLGERVRCLLHQILF